jgi:Na+/H+ antiporter NhaD/arsenite permease-like protein
MVITNDVALITFVPFTILLLQKINKEKIMIFVIALQTIAANLGSMFTPLGNPQNLYLYSVSHMEILDFLQLMMPLTLVSFVIISVTLLLLKNETISVIKNTNKTKINGKQLALFTVLFAICLLTVLHVADYRVTFIIVAGSVLIFDRKILAKADYMLLLTFVAFFIFVGNIKNIPYIEHILAGVVRGNEMMISMISSQIISNVPAAILLSGFTDNYRKLIIGTNIGGLGTLIASMASLISYKFYAKIEGARRGKYLAVFTGFNLMFIIIIVIAYRLIL